jgi:hypothetical protein
LNATLFLFVIATKKVSTVILSVSEGSPYGERFEKLDVSLTLNMTGNPIAPRVLPCKRHTFHS